MSWIKLIGSQFDYLMISLPFHLFLFLPQILKSFKKLCTILLTVKLLFRYTIFKAFMVYKMTTTQPSKEKHACATTLETTYIRWIKIHLFQWIYFFSYVSGNIRIGWGNIINKFTWIFIYFSEFLQNLIIVCLFSTSLIFSILLLSNARHYLF